ncbi:hypothetical protein PF002_g31147 [Phytophthora fragariae]|uniref:Uncharacterized protein n=1 Tax=Phytophthora fragariae TaxID=53985 RepID=A0A6A3VIJ5_9STRA|nr:hypothetical protein PF002_g31147 [Phytophthora fragariae]
MARPATAEAPPSASVCQASRVSASVWATAASVRTLVWARPASAMARLVTASRPPVPTTRPPTTASPLLP